MSITVVGSLVSIGSTVMFVILSVATLIARRRGREARDLREVRELNLAMARWQYQVEMLAARRGWDADPEWPDKPPELTVDGMSGLAVADDNNEMLEYARAVAAILQPPQDRGLQP